VRGEDEGREEEGTRRDRRVEARYKVKRRERE